MIPSGLFAQIGLLVLSIGIIFTYIQPTFTEISSAQEQIETYQNEKGKVTAVNATLQQKLQQIDRISASDRDRLLRYMPDRIDPIAVMRDIETISNKAGVILNDITDGGPVENDAAAANFDPYLYGDPVTAALNNPTNQGPFAYSFTINAVATYTQVKNLIDTLERNDYPLEIQKMSLTANEGGFLATDIVVHTYSQAPNDPIEENLYEDVNVIYE